MSDEATIHGSTETQERILAHIGFHVPDDMLSRYASNIVVQRQEHEVVISFFEVLGPIILSPDIPPPQVIRANCVARITVAKTRLQEFAEVMQRTADAIRADAQSSEEE